MNPSQRKATLIVTGVAALGLLTAGFVAAEGPFAGTGFHGAWRGRDGHRDGFTETGGSVAGHVTSFHVDVAAGTITDFAAKVNNTTTPLVDSIRIAALAGGTEKVHHAQYVLRDASRDAFLALDAPPSGFGVRSANGTTVVLTFPSTATIVTHDAVQDWSPAGATVSYGTVQADLVLGTDSTLTLSGATVTVTLAAHGILAFHLLGPHEAEHGFELEHGRLHGPEGMGRRGDRMGPGGPGGPPRDGDR